jgi:hypothetical protein
MDGDPFAAGAPMREADQAAPAAAAAAENPPKQRKALVAGAAVLAVASVVAVIVAPRLIGPSDPGCKAYSGATIVYYNKTIHDLNGQTPTSVLSPDMATAITDLTGAVAQAKSPSVKAALDGLLSDLKTVQSEVAAGTVATSTVDALNAASINADHAC